MVDLMDWRGRGIGRCHLATGVGVGALVSAINLDTRTLTRSPDSEVRTAFK